MIHLKSVIFDLDGTIIDSLPGLQYAVDASVRSVLSIENTIDLRPFIGLSAGKIFQSLIPSLKSRELDLLTKEYRRIYDNEGWRNSRLYTGVEDTLAFLNDLQIPAFIATTKPSLPTRNILDYLDIRRFLADIITPDSRVPPFMSKTEALFHLSETHRLAPENSLMIGDTNLDEEAARNCGMIFLPVTYGFGYKKEDIAISGGFRLDQISDLIELFNSGAYNI